MFTLLKAENKNSVLYYAYSFLTGVLLALPWHGFPGWILLIAIIPLLLAENHFSHRNLSIGVFLAGFIAFFTWNLIATGWMIWVNMAGGWMIILINSVLFSLVFTLFSHIRKKLGKGSGYFLLILFWLSYEYYLLHGKPGWPWLVLGNGLGSAHSFIQWYSFTGILGGSLWVLLMNVLLFRFISQPARFTSLSQFISTVLVFSIVLLLPPLLSMRMKSAEVPSTHKIDILIVQTNLDPYTQKFINDPLEQFNHLMEKTKGSYTAGTELIIWPETVLDSLWPGRAEDTRIHEIENFVEDRATGLLFGALSFREVTNSEEYRFALRKSDESYFVVSNSAFLWQQQKVQEYRKNILVPGVETVPVFFHEAFRIGYFASLGGVGGSLYTDNLKNTIKLNDSTAIIPVICFESAVGHHAVGFRPSKPFLIVNITNDGWFRFRHAYNQHLMMAKIRAIENRAEVIRVANTGISAHISVKGEVLEMLPAGTEGTMIIQANLSESLTWYARSGDFIGRISVFFTILALLLYLVQFLKFPYAKYASH